MCINPRNTTQIQRRTGKFILPIKYVQMTYKISYISCSRRRFFMRVTELQRTQIDKCRSFMNSITVVPSSRDRWVFSWGQTNLWLPVTLPSCNSSLSTPHLSPHVQSIIPLELSLQEARRTRKTIRTEWKRRHEWRKSVSKSYPQRSNLCSRLHKCEPTQLIYKIKREQTHTTTTKSLWHCTFPLLIGQYGSNSSGWTRYQPEFP